MASAFQFKVTDGRSALDKSNGIIAASSSLLVGAWALVSAIDSEGRTILDCFYAHRDDGSAFPSFRRRPNTPRGFVELEREVLPWNFLSSNRSMTVI